MSVKQADVTPSSAADSPADAGAAWHTPAKPRQISLRSSLIMLVLVCVLPGVALCSYLLYANYQLEKKRMVEQTELLASQILVELDRELAVIESGLHVLATSEHLQSGNLQHFHKIASAALESQTVYNYVLTDRQGRQVLNTLRPFGKGLPYALNSFVFRTTSSSDVPCFCARLAMVEATCSMSFMSPPLASPRITSITSGE